MDDDFARRIKGTTDKEIAKHKRQKEDIDSQLEAIIKSHMTFMERFIYEHARGITLKKFATRRFAINISRMTWFVPHTKEISIYKDDKFIDFVTLRSKEI